MTTIDELKKLLLPEPLEPGSEEWLKVISASKVASIMGLSPYKSAFTLWHEMAGNVRPETGNKATERGLYLEPAVLNWHRDQHPELRVLKASSFHHRDHSDWTASLDAVGIGRDGTIVAIEAKTSQEGGDWGEPGTAEAPPGYVVQAAFQMMVTGIREVRVPVLFGSPSFQFEEYVVRWEDVEDDVPLIEATVLEFQRSLVAGERPRLDGMDSTYQTIRKLHPQIDPSPVDLPDELAIRFLAAHSMASGFVDREARLKNEIAAFMGDAKWAIWRGSKIFTRQAKGEGVPYLVVGRSLPTFEEQD